MNRFMLSITTLMIISLFTASCMDSSSDMSKEDQITAHLQSGITLYRNKKYAAAIVDWQKVFELDPDNKQAKRYISRAKEKKPLSP